MLSLNILSSRPSGDFASKMWASYTQLNPGVYSDAIATEFKNRMKPTYADSAGTGYYYNTFGPSGLNKTTADWIGIIVTSSATVARTNIKTGSIMKWNTDGTIVTQNNVPVYTKGANAGIITFTSTDGFSGITQFNTVLCNLTHMSGLSSFVNVTNLQTSSNPLLFNTTFHVWPKLVTFQFSFCPITFVGNTGTNNMSSDNESSNSYTTATVDSRLAYYNTMFAATPPIKNLILNLSGATMGIPTGAGNNTDLLGILAKFTAAGFTATIIVRTV